MGKHVLLLSVVMGLLASGALGDSITFSRHLDTVPAGTTIAIPGFNIPGGTLTGVEFSVSGSTSGSITFINSGGPGSVSASLSTFLQLHRPDGTSLTQGLSLDSPVGGFGNVDAAISAFETKVLALQETWDGTTDATSAEADMALFTSTADVVLGLQSYGLWGYSYHSNDVEWRMGLSSKSDLTTSANISVTYLYDVPEPGALSLLLGLACPLLRRRRS